MFELKLRFRTDKAGRLVAAVPLGVRAVFGLIALVLVAGASISSEATRLPDLLRALGPAGIVAVLIALLAVLYEERWTFDPGTRVVTYRFGLLFLASTRVIPFGAVGWVGYERFVKGVRPGAAEPAEEERPGIRLGGGLFRRKVYRTIALYLVDGPRLVVETENEKKAAALEAAARQIAETVGVPLKEGPGEQTGQ